MSYGPRIITVDGIESLQGQGLSYATRRAPLCYTTTYAERLREEERGDDPEWDARMQAKWDAYDATPNGIAFNSITKYGNHRHDGHETVE